MAAFREGSNWAGTSYNPDTTHMDDNHESDLSFDEVTRLVASSVGLFPAGNLPGDAGTSLTAYRDALQSATTEVEVVKGIHQRGSDPHIRVSLLVGDARQHFHVNLVTGQRATTAVDGQHIPPRNQRFVWNAVQVSVALGEGLERKVYRYPAADPAPGRGARRRGLSFTQGQLQTHIDAAQAAAAERQRIAEETAAREAAEAAQRSAANLASLAARARGGGNPWGKK